MIRAIVFDFDGVLADSEPLHLRATQETVAALGIGLTLTREEYYSRYLGYDDATMFRVMGEVNGLRLDARQIAALIEHKAAVLDEVLLDADVLFPGAVECVERLASAYPLGIASGALRHEIQAILARHRLTRYFRFIVASGDTPASKPAPDPYRRAAELHGHPPGECLAIEDSKWGIESARAAGLKCVGITHTYEAAELAAADAVIASLQEFTVAFVRGIG